MRHRRLASILILAGATFAPEASHAAAGEAPPACASAVVEYGILANLKVQGTPMGAGDGVYRVGPGTLVLRVDQRDGEARVALLSYELGQRFVVSSRVLFMGVRVTTDIATRGAAGSAPIAEGRRELDRIRWEGPPRGLHTDGTLTCEGALCGKFGAPPEGTTAMHLALAAAELQPFTLGADGKTFTMPYARMSKTDAPQQETLIALSGRETRRTCRESP